MLCKDSVIIRQPKTRNVVELLSAQFFCPWRKLGAWRLALGGGGWSTISFSAGRPRFRPSDDDDDGNNNIGHFPPRATIMFQLLQFSLHGGIYV